MRKLPLFKPDQPTMEVAKRLARDFDRTAWNGQTLGQLTLQNLLPCPLPLVPRVNRFATGCQLAVTNFQTLLKLPTTEPSGEPISMTITIPWTMSGRPARPDIFHWAVVWHRANLRKGLASSKNRARVSGGGRKIYRQKGTGRARAGSSRAPQRRGGGVVFGPRPRDYSQALPAKIRNRSVMSALGEKLRAGRVAVVEPESLQLATHKTGSLTKILNNHEVAIVGHIEAKRRKKKEKHLKVLLVDSEPFHRNITLASQMLSHRLKLFSMHNRQELACYDILNSNLVVLTDRAVNHLLATFK